MIQQKSLNRQIAELKGYQLQSIGNVVGKRFYFDRAGWISPMRNTEVEAETNLPDWQHDIETAISLFRGDDCILLKPDPSILNKDRWSAIYNGLRYWRVRYSESFATLPAAICELWLQVEADRKT